MPERDERPESAADDEAGIGLENLRANIGEMVLKAAYGSERIGITRHGKRIAVLIGMKDFERLQSLDAANVAA